jgi:hypothetical protein
MTNYTGKALIRCQKAGSLPALHADADATGEAFAANAGAGMEMGTAPARRALVSYEDIGEAAFGPAGRAAQLDPRLSQG